MEVYGLTGPRLDPCRTGIGLLCLVTYAVVSRFDRATAISVRHPIRLGRGDFPPVFGDTVVAASLVMRLARDVAIALLYQGRHNHPYERAVEGSGQKPHLVVGALLHLLHNGVAVSFLVGQRQEDIEDGRASAR